MFIDAHSPGNQISSGLILVMESVRERGQSRVARKHLAVTLNEDGVPKSEHPADGEALDTARICYNFNESATNFLWKTFDASVESPYPLLPDQSLGKCRRWQRQPCLVDRWWLNNPKCGIFGGCMPGDSQAWYVWSSSTSRRYYRGTATRFARRYAIPTRRTKGDSQGHRHHGGLPEALELVFGSKVMIMQNVETDLDIINVWQATDCRGTLSRRKRTFSVVRRLPRHIWV
ncbi:hypothetical protein EDD16DRAFT_1527222 [Pisolithus croceorrhizus]|nr:hypothetical protein EDD16DRAFT_1527222 [Pisolithus croceorrhizus]